MAYKYSFFITIGIIFLTPLFFIPGGALDLASAKSALFSIGIMAGVLAFLYETWKSKNVSIPKSFFFLAALLLPVVYFLSAILATPSSLSLLGYNLEAGTFGFMLLGAALLALAALTISSATEALQALVALFASLSILVLFAVIKILVGPSTLLGVNNMGNPLGNWTDLAIASGLLAALSALSLGMVPMKRNIKLVIYAVFALSTFLLVVANFSTAFILTLGASVFLFFYMRRVESQFLFSSATGGNEGNKGRLMLPIALGVISLVFLLNPVNISGTISGIFEVSNTDVRPTLSATLSISKQVLSQVALLGSGPNTFGADWLVFKPASVNATPFWGVAFPFGVGFVPTQIATTGILGSALWFLFLVLLIALAVKALDHIPESRASRFVLISVLISTLFLWAGSLIYTPSESVLLLAFVLSGILIAVLKETGVLSARAVSFEAKLSSLAILSGVLALSALYMGWTGVEKSIAAFHFRKAIDLSNTAGAPLSEIEAELNKAVGRAPVDTHYVAISRINFFKAQAAASTSSPQAATIFQESLGKSIQAARSAVAANPASYSNWVSLGLIYAALVPEPLKVEGAYENARFAYSEALKRNPVNPELPLLFARLEISNDSIEAARSHIRNSIALKEDYADAYLMLAQLEVAEGNTAAAIASTEVLSRLAPNNAGIHFELGLLKHSSNDFSGAALSFSRALELLPDYANAKYYLALSLKELGQTAEARRHLEELLKANPDNEALETALKELDRTIR